jgi:small subunit ribosomal protein S17e
LGKVRSERVKKIARELTSKYSDRFSADFEANKKIVTTIIDIPSKRLRNRIAGYITRLNKTTETAETAEISDIEE